MIYKIMARKVTAVEVSYDKIIESGIEVNSTDWFQWLEGSRSFHYTCSQGHFTANKNSKGYWYAQRRSETKLLQHYLGQSRKLTLEILKEAASKLSLAVIDNRPHNRPVRALEEQSCKSCMTDEERLRQSSKEELIELVAHLKNKLHDYKTVPDTSPQSGDEIAELRAENETLKGKISYLLDERGLIQAKVNDDARVRIEQLEKQNKQLDNAEWEMQKRYTVVDELAQKRLKQLQALQSKYDSLVCSLKSAKQYKLHGRQVIRVDDFEAWLEGQSDR